MPVTIQQIIDEVKKNDPRADTDMIMLAYEFAEKAHSGQKRRSGESYLQHPLNTALTLAQIKAESEVVVAGLLHDVPEDTGEKLKEIEKGFKEIKINQEISFTEYAMLFIQANQIKRGD